jgi:hypothetical protein
MPLPLGVPPNFYLKQDAKHEYDVTTGTGVRWQLFMHFVKYFAKPVRDEATLCSENILATVSKCSKTSSQQCVSNGRGNMKGEGKYRALYEDIAANKQQWMAFFDERDNYVHAEHTCGILVRMMKHYRTNQNYCGRARPLRPPSFDVGKSLL